MALPRGATGLSAVCDCGISRSYSLTILNTDSKEKANICYRQFQLAFTREDDSDPPSKGAIMFLKGYPLEAKTAPKNRN